MIEITRLLAKQVRTVLRKLLGSHGMDLRLVASAEGLHLQAQSFEHAAEYHDAAPREPAELIVPFAVLDDTQGTKNDPVVLSAPKRSVLAATWEERSVPHTMQYRRPKDIHALFPAPPDTLAENPPSLLKALRDAYETTDMESSRYALGCVQLRGKAGEIAATDGRHLLLQSGFTFGFEDEVLVQNTKVFGCKELPQDQPVRLGRSAQHVMIRVGPWTFYLGLHKEGRFPRLEDVIPAVPSARTTLELNGADAEFLLANLHRLPGDADEPGITLDLGSTISIRAKTIDTPTPTEIVLSNSHKSGSDMMARIDRRYLARAAALSFSQIYSFGAAEPMLARDASRLYLWMPLGSEGAIAASANCLRIESPAGTQRVSPQSHPISQSPVSMSNNQTVEPPAAAPESSPPSTPQSTRRTRRVANVAKAGALEQALALREQLRTALVSTKGLIQALKSEKRSHKSLRLALDSLKQLQAVA